MQVKANRQKAATGGQMHEVPVNRAQAYAPPGSDLLARRGEREAEVKALESLKGASRQPTRELGQQILARLSVPLPGLKIYEDEGLAELGERAYARGNEIHVAKGEYSPHTQAGQELLLHEAGHIAQQGAGMARGEGILHSPQLEAGADGGFAVPQGFSMPTSAQGAPIQGWDGFANLRKRIGGAAEALRERARETGRDVARGVGNVGTAIGYGAGRVAEYANEKRKDVARGVGNVGTVIGYGAGRVAEYANEKRKDVTRGIGNVGTLIGHGARKAGTAVRDAVMGKRDSLVRQHHRAVDQLNRNREDYASMSKWERFKWTAQNPLARAMASREQEGTRQRGQHDREIEAQAQAMRANVGDIGDAGSFHTSPPGSSAQEGTPSPGSVPRVQESFSGTAKTVKDKVMQGGVETAVSAASLGAGLLAPSASKVLGARGITPQNAAPLTAFGRVAGTAGGVLQAADAGLSGMGNMLDLASSARQGNRSEAAVSGLKIGQNLLSGAAAGGKIAGYTASGTQTLASMAPVIPGIGVAQGALQMGVGGVHLASGTSTRMAMSRRIEAMQGNGPLTRDQERLRRTFEQARGVAKIKQVQGGVELAQGALQTTGNALTLGGVTAPVGAVVSGVGTAVGMAGKMATGKMGKSLRTATVEQETGLAGRIKKYREDHPDVSERDAKHIILKSMGFSSGKRREAFQHITMRRAMDLTDTANASRPANGAIGQEDAAKAVEDMGVHRTGRGYSLQAVSESLGMDRGTTWQDQVRATAASRTANPFREQAEQARQGRLQEEAKKAAKEAEKARKKKK